MLGSQRGTSLTRPSLIDSGSASITETPLTPVLSAPQRCAARDPLVCVAPRADLRTLRVYCAAPIYAEVLRSVVVPRAVPLPPLLHRAPVVHANAALISKCESRLVKKAMEVA
jgi:hypothetical protein